ncbi:T9SS type A sorting domain-containing protein [Aureivirga marina]|uniref:T9SS type A sorting domain-containing protein n=1 Tax=Aureivirga marina TaxID=1182451 RepID=UPI0018CBDAFB|nr:T9SS type A sorting domain-containing protein [Aureivirga marina]
MKKITLIASLFFASFCANAQVNVGDGTEIDQHTPINPYFNYSYSQNIYLGSEINTSGNISGVKFYLDTEITATLTISKSDEWEVWIGHTSKTKFDSSTDLIPLTDEMKKFTGTVAITNTNEVEVTFDSAFDYNGTDNLFIAVKDNKDLFNSSQIAFYNTNVTEERSIYKISSSAFDEETLTEATNIDFFVPNITFLMGDTVTTECVVPTEVNSENVTTTSADISWTAEGEDSFEINVIPSADTMPEDGVATSTNPHSVSDLTPNTEYKVYVRTVCEGDVKSDWSEMHTFNTKELGIEENIIEGLKVYPNPSKDILTVSAKEVIRKVEIFNTLGQKVMERELNSTSGKLNLGQLNEGSYTMKLTTDKTVSSVRIVKN